MPSITTSTEVPAFIGSTPMNIDQIKILLK